MRKKLRTFLENCRATVVFSLARTKRLMCVDPETGEAAPKRKLPKRRTPYQVCPELYALKDLLLPCNLSRSISMLGVDEYRLKNAWNKAGKKAPTAWTGFPFL